MTRTLTTVAQLDALALPALVTDTTGADWHKRRDGRWLSDGGDDLPAADVLRLYGDLTVDGPAPRTAGDTLTTAANLVEKTATMLTHLAMDTPEDQELHDRVTATLRDAAHALRRATPPVRPDLDVAAHAAFLAAYPLSDRPSWDDPLVRLTWTEVARAVLDLTPGLAPPEELREVIARALHDTDMGTTFVGDDVQTWERVNQNYYLTRADAVISILPGPTRSDVTHEALHYARQVISQYLSTAEKWRYDRIMWAFAIMLGEIPEDSPEPGPPAPRRTTPEGPR